MFTVNFVAMNRDGVPILDELAGEYASVPEAVFTFMELFSEEPPCASLAFVCGPSGVIVATITEVKREAAVGGWNEVVIVGPTYPDGERWQTSWKDGEFLKRRVSADVAVVA